MAGDDSFVTPGSIPFVWEIRPGVPKTHYQELSPPFDQQVDLQDYTQSPSSFPCTPRKLKPPPAGSPNLHRAPVIRPYETQSVSQGCFPTSPVLRQKSKRKGIKKILKPEVGSECEYSFNIEKLARWPESSWKSSAFYDAASSPSFSSYGSSFSSYRSSPQPASDGSSFASYRSSPRPASDAEWAGFGLF